MKFTQYKLGDFCQMKYGKMPPKEVLSDEGFPVFSGYRITGYAKEYLWDESRVIVVARGVGGTGDVKMSPEKAWITNLSIVLEHDNRIVSKRFLFYRLGIEPLKDKLNTGAAQAQITIDSLKPYPLSLPDLGIQERIASILSAYDDQIENNRRRIQLLEQAARLLYKEWFVHFRFPGHEHVKIKNGVPAGWENGTVSDFFDTTSGGTPSRKRPEFFSGDINWVKTQELNEDFIFETEEKITPEALTKSSAKLFPADTLLVSIYGGTNIGRTGILAKPAASNQACVALFPRHPSSNFIFAQLFLQTIRNSLIGIAQGAAQTNISQQTFRKIAMVMPPSALMRSFLDSLTPVYVQLKNLKLQNMNFEKARDLLLPRLMNGDVSV